MLRRKLVAADDLLAQAEAIRPGLKRYPPWMKTPSPTGVKGIRGRVERCMSICRRGNPSGWPL